MEAVMTELLHTSGKNGFKGARTMEEVCSNRGGGLWEGINGNIPFTVTIFLI